MAEINLIPAEEVQSKSFDEFRSRITAVSIIALVITAVLTLGTLAAFITLINEKTKLLTQVEAASQRIDSMKAKEELIFVTKGKVQTAAKILGSRTDYPGFFDKLSQIVPNGIYFTDVKFSATKVIFTGKAKTSADLAGFVSALVSAKGSQILANVNVDSLNLAETGVYDFTISSQLVSTAKTGKT